MRAIHRAAHLELGDVADELFGEMNFELRVPIDEAQAMWGRLTELDTDGTLGTRIGRRQLNSDGILLLLNHAAGAQSNLARALRITSRYYALVSSHAELSIGIVGESDKRELRVRSIYGAGARSRTVSQATLAALLEAIRATSSDPVKPLRVHFSAPAPPVVCERLKRLYEAPVFAGTGEDALYLAAELASAPLTHFDSEKARVLEGAVKNALMAMETTSVFQEEVVKEIQAMLPEAPTLEAVGSRLGFTRRSFQRRLSSESVSFRKLCLSTRLEIARGYLEAGGSVTDVAFLVGYSDATTFSRAYRKAMGHPPNEDSAGNIFA